MPTRADMGKANSPEPAEAETTRVERIIPADATRAERIIPAVGTMAGDEAPSDDDGVAGQASDASMTVAFDASREDAEDTAVARDADAAHDVEDAPGISDAGDVDDVSANSAEGAEVPADVTATTPVPEAEVPEADVPGTAALGAEPDSRRVTVVPGVPRYHHDDCILVRFLDDGDVEHISVAEAEQSGCTPCRACHPED